MDIRTQDAVRASADEVKRFLAVFAAGSEGLVTELRALRVPQPGEAPVTVFGFFELTTEPRAAFLSAVASCVGREPSQQPEGVYVTINPLPPKQLPRANNRLAIARKKGVVACDADVAVRRWVVVDIDRSAPAKVSATDAEKAAVRLVADGLREDLQSRGWPDPMVADSGNGYHLWFRIELPADDGGLVVRTLRALAARHDTPAAVVDTTVSNPSRIMKLPGTWARKGADTPDRPHRMARVLEVPPS